jgi:hypothetical protein
VGLTTAEIRDRAERFRAAVFQELHDVRSGRKAWPELAPLFETQGILESSRTLPVIERAIASADDEDERELRKLLRWAARHHLEAHNAHLDDEFAHWRATAKVQAGHIAVPVSQAANLVYASDSREARRQLEEAHHDTLEEAVPLQLDRLSRWREAAAELGYGGYREAVERLAGVNLLGVLSEARRLIDETEDVYREVVRDELQLRLGIRPEDAESHDAGWLKRMPWLDGSCQEGDVLGILRKDLRDIGLPLEYGGHVTLEHEPFPGPGMIACCTPVRVPDQIHLLVTPTITQPGCVALLTSVGRALHYVYTDPRLSFEDRALGDLAVVKGHGLLFAGLSREGAWVRRTRGLQGEALEEYLRTAAVTDLFALREAAARLEFEIELSEEPSPGELGPAWAERLTEATGFRFHPRSFLERLGQRFGVARFLRGRMLAAQLRREIRERFDEDWYRNPLTGPFLGDWFSHGLRFSAAELGASLGNDRLDADALISDLREPFA